MNSKSTEKRLQALESRQVNQTGKVVAITSHGQTGEEIAAFLSQQGVELESRDLLINRTIVGVEGSEPIKLRGISYGDDSGPQAA